MTFSGNACKFAQNHQNCDSMLDAHHPLDVSELGATTLTNLQSGQTPGLALIAAYSKRTRVIGNKNGLPWHKPEDMKFFKNATHGHAVIMGRKSFESLGKPLPNRINIVLTRHHFQSNFPSVQIYGSLEDAISISHKQGKQPPFIIGGEQIYTQALQKNLVTHMYLTEILEDYEGDAFFPAWETFGGDWIEVYSRTSDAGDLVFRTLVKVMA